MKKDDGSRRWKRECGDSWCVRRMKEKKKRIWEKKYKCRLPNEESTLTPDNQIQKEQPHSLSPHPWTSRFASLDWQLSRLICFHLTSSIPPRHLSNCSYRVSARCAPSLLYPVSCSILQPLIENLDWSTAGRYIWTYSYLLPSWGISMSLNSLFDVESRYKVVICLALLSKIPAFDSVHHRHPLSIFIPIFLHCNKFWFARTKRISMKRD